MPETLVAEPIRLTYADFRALPDGKRYEIIDGELHVSPSPQRLHQQALFRLARILADHIEGQRLGEIFLAPFDVLLAESSVVEPDIVYVSNARRHIITEENIQGVPDLLIEVLSPNRPEVDTRGKRNLYARHGVPFYWMVDPTRRELTELQLVGSAYAVASRPAGVEVFAPKLFPGLTVPLEKLWA